MDEGIALGETVLKGTIEAEAILAIIDANLEDEPRYADISIEDLRKIKDLIERQTIFIKVMYEDYVSAVELLQKARKRK